MINKKDNKKIQLNLDLTPRQKKIIKAGGLLNFTKMGEK